MNARLQRHKGQRLLADPHAVLMVGYKGPQNLHEPEFLSIEEIHRRAETMTPVLKEILDFRPSPHWK